MSKLPNFTSHGYQVISILGHNLMGGRVVYLAQQNLDEQPVVIKQFQVAKAVDWSGFQAIEREMQVLKGLEHPGIPRYLGSFDTEDGFCIVQEHKNAQPLAKPRSFDVDEVKEIGIQLLEMLVYLQNRIPPIVHRDIKPENILIDDHLNVYLIDFGLARIGSGEVSLSTIAAGTFGFMAPEQIYNRTLTTATDLYGLGATLICLLTNTKSTTLETLVDEDGVIRFRHLLPRLSTRFLDWLEKLVAPKPKDRFPDAETALMSLKPLDMMRIPTVEISVSTIEFMPKVVGEKVTQLITITNSVEEALLGGRWEVAPHHHDPAPVSECHTWISLTPSNFMGNRVQCEITVDTSKLMSGHRYQRQILLHTNAYPETYAINVNVKTAPLAIGNTNKGLYWSSVLGYGCYAGTAWVVALLTVVAIAKVMAGDPAAIVVVPALAAAVSGYGTACKYSSWKGFTVAIITGTIAGGITTACLGFSDVVILSGAIAGLGVGGMAGAVTGMLAGTGKQALAGMRSHLVQNLASQRFTQVLSSAIVIAGMCLGLSLQWHWQPYLWLAVAATHIPLIALFLYSPIQRRRLVAAYRQHEQHLIRP